MGGFQTIDPPDLITYPVADCPHHASSALRMPSGRTFCYACGLEVVADLIAVDRLDVLPADDALKAEAREAWNGSRVIRDFAANCQPGTTPLRR